MFFVYVLKSKSFGRYYIGSTENVERRLAIHKGSHAKWTKRFQPWELVDQEQFETRGEAAKERACVKGVEERRAIFGFVDG
jgi:putative endonuclease